MLSQILALIIAIVLFSALLQGKYPRYLLTLAAGGAMVLVVLLGTMGSPAAALEALSVDSFVKPQFWFAHGGVTEFNVGINWSTILFLAGMMIMVEAMSEAGFFDWVCLRLAKALGFRPMPLMLSFMVLAALLLSIGIASAELNYILPDSNSRELTWDEVARWDYETLGYAFNEIFARHGYVFHPGEKYDNYFSCQPWYTPNRDTNNQRAVYPYLNATEWANYELIKEVRSYKAENGDSGESMWTYFSGGFDTLGGFDYVQLRTGQNLPVYSAPSRNSWRGTNGKASIGTNGAIYSAGWENGWLLVMYETNSGSVRVGYVSGDDIRGGVPMDTSLTFSYATATLNAGTALTDDPAMRKTTIAQLRAGTQVTYLTSFFNKSAWDYIETTVDGQTTRGFVPAGCLTIHGD